MNRVTKTAGATGCLGVLLLAAGAAIHGCLHGGGFVGAVFGAMSVTVFYGLTVFGIGAIAGAGAAVVGIAVGRLRSHCCL